jgi:hypothetical protein
MKLNTSARICLPSILTNLLAAVGQDDALRWHTVACAKHLGEFELRSAAVSMDQIFSQRPEQGGLFHHQQ